jgi:hypothetical protein
VQIFRNLLTISLLTSFVAGCDTDCETSVTMPGLECSSTLVSAEDRPVLDYPDFGVRVSSATANTSLRRVTNNDLDSENSPQKHQYSRRQVWNIDETLVDLGSKILHYETLTPAIPFEPMSSERNWSNVYPNLMIGLQFNPKLNELVTFDLVTKKYELVHKFNEYDHCTMGEAEGNLSDDDERLVLTCQLRDSEEKDIIAYSLLKREVLGTLRAKENMNWASFSHTGNYILVENNNYPEPDRELLRYNPDFTDPLLLSKNPEHGDFGLDELGNDVFVMIQDREILYIRLADRLPVKLLISGWFSPRLGYGHISCRSNLRPNWCYISTYSGTQVGAVKIGSPGPLKKRPLKLHAKAINGPKVYEHWGFHNSTKHNYESQAKASVSPTGTKVIFTSNWLDEQTINDFVLEIAR